MKKILTKAILILLLAVAAVPCLAQQRSTVNFAYDANGNRISRTLGMKKVNENGKDVEADTPMLSEAIDSFGAMNVGLYPNPTHALLRVEIENNESDATLKMALVTTTGEILQELTTKGNQETIDLTKYPAGMYFLELVSDKEHHTWKIVKY